MEQKNDLRTYDYSDNSTLSSRYDQLKKYFDKKFNDIDVGDIDVIINDAFDKNLEELKVRLDTTDTNIDNAKNEIIQTINDNNNDNNQGCHCCCPTVISDNSINKIIEGVNHHTDEKFNEVDFVQRFTDLNEQIKQLNK